MCFLQEYCTYAFLNISTKTCMFILVLTLLSGFTYTKAQNATYEEHDYDRNLLNNRLNEIILQGRNLFDLYMKRFTQTEISLLVKNNSVNLYKWDQMRNFESSKKAILIDPNISLSDKILDINVTILSLDSVRNTIDVHQNFDELTIPVENNQQMSRLTSTHDDQMMLPHDISHNAVLKNMTTKDPIYINFTSCSQIGQATFISLDDNCTVKMHSPESISVLWNFTSGAYRYEFKVIEYVGKSVYCTGLSKFEIAVSEKGFDGTHVISFGFNSSLPNGFITVDENCWNTRRTALCITTAYVLEAFMFLPMTVYPPSNAKFWDFRSNVFNNTYGWLKSITVKTLLVDWDGLINLNNSNIEELVITKNLGTYLPRGVPTLPCLKILDLTGTIFVDLPSDQLRNVPRLKKLALSNSVISSQFHRLFSSDLKHLKVWEFSNVRTSGFLLIQSSIHTPMSLEEINLSYNKIMMYSVQFPQLLNLKYLNFSFLESDYFYLKSDTFNNLTALKILDLSGNNINYLPPKIFNNQNLTFLYLSQNKLYQMSEVMFLNQYYTLLDISYNRFSKWPKIKNCEIEFLDMSHNRLFNMTDFSLMGTRITFLDVSRNNITGWSNSDIFLNNLPSNISNGINSTNSTWLENIDLAHNNIQVVSVAMTESLDNLQSVDITGNPFDCSDCSIPMFQNWLNTSGHEIVRSPDSLKCASPVSKLGMLVGDFIFYEESCLAKVSHLFLQLGIPLIVVAGMIIAGVTATYVYRFELSYMRHLLRLRGRKVEDQYNMCLYDAFICFSGRDRPWVINYLAPSLEKSTEKYKLCLHDRDFPVGTLIVENIVHSIEKSRRTVIVLTDEFVSSKWCQWELEMANQRMFENAKNFVILLQLERLNQDNLPRHLKMLMTTRTYLEWPHESRDKKAERTAMTRLKKALGPSIFQTTSETAPLLG